MHFHYMTYTAMPQDKNFILFTPKLSPLGVGGHEIYKFFRCYVPNLVKIGPVVLEKKMF